MRALARAAREGQRDESTVNTSDSKLKFWHTSALGNLLLFPSIDGASCESTYARRKVENNNETKFTVFKNKLYAPRARAAPAGTRRARRPAG